MLNEKKKAEMKAEAIDRLKKIGVSKRIVDEFEKDGTLNYSERLNAAMPAALFWLNGRGDLMERVREIEAHYDCMVYHAILTHLADGEMVDFLIVGKYKRDWPSERKDLNDGIAMSYCVSPYAEEFGSIGISPAMGGMMRRF